MTLHLPKEQSHWIGNVTHSFLSYLFLEHSWVLMIYNPFFLTNVLYKWSYQNLRPVLRRKYNIGRKLFFYEEKCFCKDAIFPKDKCNGGGNISHWLNIEIYFLIGF